MRCAGKRLKSTMRSIMNINETTVGQEHVWWPCTLCELLVFLSGTSERRRPERSVSH